MTDPELPVDAQEEQGRPVQPAEADDTRGITARRQPGYDAVFAYIRSLGDHMPPDPVHRNALIWRGVAAALDALDGQAVDTELQQLQDLLGEAVGWIHEGELRERIVAVLNPQEQP